jgi:hypothetical protein
VLGAHYGAHANVVLAEKFGRWKVAQSFAAPYLEFPELSLISYVKPVEKNLKNLALQPWIGWEWISSLR